jgi:hypothetical protein
MSVVGLQPCDGAQLSSHHAVIMQVGVARTPGKYAIRTSFRISEKFGKKWEDLEITNNAFSCFAKSLH